MTAAGDEVAFIQRIERVRSTDGLCLLCGRARQTTKKHWQDARRGGGEHRRSDLCAGGRDRTCWCGRRGLRRRLRRKAWTKTPDLKTPAVVAAHPAAVMLALVPARLQAKLR